jgi:hypothetical protein
MIVEKPINLANHALHAAQLYKKWQYGGGNTELR